MLTTQDWINQLKGKVREFYDFHKNEDNFFNLPNSFEEFVESKEHLERHIKWLCECEKFSIAGQFYTWGIYVEENDEKAFDYFEKGAIQTDNYVCHSALGSCYHRGKGTKKNLEKAVIHYSRVLELEKNHDFARKNMNRILEAHPKLYKMLYHTTQEKLIETEKNLKQCQLKLAERSSELWDAKQLIDNHFEYKIGGPGYNKTKEKWGTRSAENDIE